MKTITYQPETATASIDIQSDATWDALYHLLTPKVRNWVYHAQVPSWRGQELDVAGDILQTALRKTFEYALNAEQHRIAIASLERLSIVIAKNQLRDQRRKDSRLLHIERDADSPEAETAIFYEEEDPAEAILERLHEGWIFREVAKEVVRFPEKMRLAVLIDLATRLKAQGEFYGGPSPLCQAFLDEGVHLEEFAGLLPPDPVARARHSSLVSLGYKRIAKIVGCRSDLIYVDALLQGNEIRKDGLHA
jgi:DNA-directed RNA polymerase specialized sigma24 family protein